MATHTINFSRANLNTFAATIGTGGLIVDSESLVVDATNNRVGIGSSIPTSTLDVNGAVTLSDTLSVGGAVTFSSSDEATSLTTGAISVPGGISTSTNIHASNIYTQGGLITHRAATCKKTYSHKGTILTGATIAEATFIVTFSNHIFMAKIYGTLVEGTSIVSSLTQECTGGHLTGGTPPNIVLGTTNLIGHNSYPWSSVAVSSPTTVTLKPAQDMDVAYSGHYNIFIEYLSAHPDGRVIDIQQGGATAITFNY